MSPFIHTERKITSLSLALCMILHSGKDYTTLMSSVFGHVNSRILKSISSAVAQWLKCCATNRKFAGSIPAGAIGIFH